MKRFYAQARAVEAPRGWGVALDARPLSTPQRTAMIVPQRALAEAIAEEWRAQGERIDLASLRLTRLVGTALDRIGPDPAPAIAEVTGYAATDLLCHRAAAPADLRARQEALWQPLVDWAAAHFGAALTVTTGVMPAVHPAPALARLRAAVAALDALRLAGLHGAVTASGSLILGLALLHGHIDAAEAWQAADLDQRYQREKWAEDAEAARGRTSVRRDLETASRLLALVTGG